MSGTPETDDIARGNHVVPTEWAQQLERERDEARELLASEKITRNHIIKRSVEVERERDEAMEEIKEWKTLCLWGGTPEHIHGFIRGQQSRIQHLERERDEASESLKHISEYGTEEINAAVELRQKLATALVERDEAREEGRRLKAILDLLKKEAQ